MQRPETLRLALAQIDPTVGDIDGNERLIAEGLEAARAAGAQLAVFGELVLSGYPPEDLVLKEHFLADVRAALERLAARSEGIAAVVGFPERAEDVFNSAALLAGGEVAGVYRKQRLPNYGVFDERRYFRPGERAAVFEIAGTRVALTVCEDMWSPGGTFAQAVRAGATVALNVSASPYHAGKHAARELMFAQRARDASCAVAFCNITGGQDELVFDGSSAVIDHTGVVLARAAQFEPELLVADVEPQRAAAAQLHDERHREPADAAVEVLARLQPNPAAQRSAAPARVAEPLEPQTTEVHAALLCGLRDYVHKNRFEHVIIGLSGGIDSALVACLAVDALGAERVTVAIMPSPHSSAETQADARALAANLGVEALELPIRELMAAYDATLERAVEGGNAGLARENLQARIRGNLLMALSNRYDWLVLTTGNKSELSVGYSTLYGDLAGGFAPIKDCPKLLVYELARARNERGGPPVIPPSVLERAPSAELRPDQRDTETLPPYDVLDPILEAHVERDMGPAVLAAEGFAPEHVERVVDLVRVAEYKRRQAPPGIKITPRAFGRDRRMPITNRYRG